MGEGVYVRVCTWSMLNPGTLHPVGNPFLVDQHVYQPILSLSLICVKAQSNCLRQFWQTWALSKTFSSTAEIRSPYPHMRGPFLQGPPLHSYVIHVSPAFQRTHRAMASAWEWYFQLASEWSYCAAQSNLVSVKCHKSRTCVVIWSRNGFQIPTGFLGERQNDLWTHAPLRRLKY